MTVALVVVSQSRRLALGVKEVVGQVAPDVQIIAAGGNDDGALGTSHDLILDALIEASNPDGVAVFADVGFAVVAAKAAVDSRTGNLTPVRLAQAPLVEGAVAAAVAARNWATLESVVNVAERVGRTRLCLHDAGSDCPHTESVTRHLSWRVKGGLQAWQATSLAILAVRFDATVMLNGVAATSVLDLMALGLIVGTRIEVKAHGPDADAAIEAITMAIADGLTARL